MNNRFSAFEAAFIIGFFLFLLVAYFGVVLKSLGDTVEVIVFTGFWLIISFLLMTGVIGLAHWQDRVKSPVP